MKYLTTKIVFVFSLLLAVSLSAFAAPEAEYKKLAKSWTLHADGSQEFRCNMELTLFTHTAMNSTYGESFIVYNPAYQTLKINESYTRQKDGTVIKTPANAFVEVLPGKAANAPAYNGLKEMVVVHTGLELGATICLDYTLTTKAGYFPELDLYEPVGQSSPVKECSFSVSVPDTKTLNYHLSGLNVEPVVVTDGGQHVYTWTLRNVKAQSRLADVYHFDAPYFVANTYASAEAMAQTLAAQMDTAKDLPVLRSVAESVVEGAKTDIEKIKAVYAYIQQSYAHIPLDLSTCGYHLRPLEEVIYSAYGTDAELVNVFQGLLKAAGVKADVCAVYPQTEATGMGLKPVTLYVAVETGGQKICLAPTPAATSQVQLLRQYCPSLCLSTGAVEEARFQQTPVSCKAELTLKDDKVSTKTEATIADFFLDIEGKTAQNIISGDRKAQIHAENAVTKFCYTGQTEVEKAGDYLILPLPDYPFSAARHTGITESDRDIQLTLPVAFDEAYTYQVHLGGKTLCTPVTDLKINNAVGSVEINIHPEGDGAVVKRTLKLTRTQISPEQYADYVKLMRAWGDTNYTRLLVK